MSRILKGKADDLYPSLHSKTNGGIDEKRLPIGETSHALQVW